MYSSWAAKQRGKLILTGSIIGFVLLFAYITINTYKPPSCFDGKMNQDEIGVDCGGVCDLMCSSQIKPLKVLWTRSFEISKTGLWSAFAYIENPNSGAYVPSAKYRFSIYDKNDELILSKEGTTFITEGSIAPIFVGRINIGNKKPYQTRFEWTEPLVWKKVEEVYKVKLEEQNFSGNFGKPEITATLINEEPYLLNDIEVVAIVYDENENAVAVSKTYVDSLSPRGKRHITFSWMSRFERDPKRWQLIVRIPPQKN